MAEASKTQSLLRQNLLDAGCGLDTIQRCMELAGRQESMELLRLLFRHRQELLDQVHRNEKRVDCLDYLIYQIKKQKI